MAAVAAGAEAPAERWADLGLSESEEERSPTDNSPADAAEAHEDEADRNADASPTEATEASDESPAHGPDASPAAARAGGRSRGGGAGGQGAQDLAAAGLPSWGSRLHALGRCKPCAFVHTKGCNTGESCPFCHLCPPFEKQRRKRLKQNLSRHILASLAGDPSAAHEPLFRRGHSRQSSGSSTLSFASGPTGFSGHGSSASTATPRTPGSLAGSMTPLAADVAGEPFSAVVAAARGCRDGPGDARSGCEPPAAATSEASARGGLKVGGPGQGRPPFFSSGRPPVAPTRVQRVQRAPQQQQQQQQQQLRPQPQQLRQQPPRQPPRQPPGQPWAGMRQGPIVMQQQKQLRQLQQQQQQQQQHFGYPPAMMSVQMVNWRGTPMHNLGCGYVLVPTTFVPAPLHEEDEDQRQSQGEEGQPAAGSSRASAAATDRARAPRRSGKATKEEPERSEDESERSEKSEDEDEEKSDADSDSDEDDEE